MNTDQIKLSKSEWQSIEIPLDIKETNIIKFIYNSFNDVNRKENNNNSLINFLKIDNNKSIMDYIFVKYFEDEIVNIFKNSNVKYNYNVNKEKKILNKADLIRFQNLEKNILKNREFIFEYKLLEYIELFLKNHKKEKELINNYYVIKNLLTCNIKNINIHVIKIINEMLNYFKEDIEKKYIVFNIKELTIGNANLIKYQDMQLFDHQKQIFTEFKNSNNKMILYIAPTGTGKTLTPLGLLNSKKVIFVCAIRHIGLALAKAAISIEKCIAFAFGCNDIDDIRLHYYSAKEFMKDSKSGGIFKVDNSVGDKVELMICDIKSYEYAMNYMLGFNNKEDLILYWDEPTVTLDYKEHKCHEFIKNNWNKNLIPNIVLSSATLPDINELNTTLVNYKNKFDGDVITIKTFDYKKSISILDNSGMVVMPHNYSENIEDIVNTCKYLKKNNTLLRYLDIDECINYIKLFNKFSSNSRLYIDNYFQDIDKINLESVKDYYLECLSRHNEIYNLIKIEKIQRLNSSIHITTSDAHTLVDGPTIYLCENVNKIALFCLQSLNIPSNLLDNICNMISKNNEINKKIEQLQKNYEDILSKQDIKENKLINNKLPAEALQLGNNIDLLKRNINIVTIPEIYVPNSKDHIIKWNLKNSKDSKNSKNLKNCFTSEISEYVVEQIMLIDDIDDMWKILLLVGIGVFSNHESRKYTEIMKDLAVNKKLFLIIATSDYIYGTNYQFDHCYLGKDLNLMTSEKIIQAMGRVGRNKISDNYSIRLRDNNIIRKIFLENTDKIEVYNFDKLFS
tara:strand:+ start:326 stop:2704 length:2379 start_codon:yes stop_codon:yes gene_type:complete